MTTETTTRPIRAIYKEGVFWPLDPTGLPDNVEVVMEVQSVHPARDLTDRPEVDDQRTHAQKFLAMLDEIRAYQAATGYVPPTAEDVDAEIAALRAEWDERDEFFMNQ